MASELRKKMWPIAEKQLAKLVKLQLGMTGRCKSDAYNITLKEWSSMYHFYNYVLGDAPDSRLLARYTRVMDVASSDQWNLVPDKFMELIDKMGFKAL